ncbi:RNA 2',3'-cyclic phosphodiesterase [Rheinheimera sp.]|uniref:RNA 2',3'-cyclic phosphodiesterase n=1 Tax=Rheinheimera sp. TaxID=1869214 RepID=UPI00307D21E4
MQRCFFSLSFSPAQQQQLAACQPVAQYPDALWHPPANLHLTLVFLGQQSEETQQQLWQDALPLLQRTPAFELCFDHLAQFHQARVLFLGLQSGVPALMDLQAGLSALCQPVLTGPQPEQFLPHVTLARKIRPEFSYRQSAGPVTVQCTDVGFYHSVSTLSGVRYLCKQRQTLV